MLRALLARRVRKEHQGQRDQRAFKAYKVRLELKVDKALKVQQDHQEPKVQHQ